MLEQRLEDDIKTALLAHDSERAATLRTIKSVLLSVKVNTGKRESGLTDDEVIPIFAKEAKKRQESADLYIQGGSQERADKELAEKAIIETYLPAQLSEAELIKLVETAIASTPTQGNAAMGQIIGAVKAQAGANANGALIAKLVRERL
jgi:uncharacterized protein YqeY